MTFEVKAFLGDIYQLTVVDDYLHNKFNPGLF